MWSKRDRVMAVLNGEQPDRPPIFECVAHDELLAHFGGSVVAVDDIEAVARACDKFLDLCHPALAPREPRRVEHDDGSAQVVERWNTWTIPARIENFEKALKDAIESQEKQEPISNFVEQFRKEVRAIDKCVSDMVYIHIGVSCPILPFDLEQGIYAYYDCPHLVKQWNRMANERGLRLVEAMCAIPAGPVAIIWNDIACKNRMIYPEHLLAELFYPHLRRMVDLLHANGVKALFHSDGDVTEALASLAACGIDAFNPLEISAGMDPGIFRELCPDVALVGGIDAVDVLAKGTVETVVRRTGALMDLFRDRGRLMVASASGEVDNSMPLENVLAMYETVWGGRPRT